MVDALFRVDFANTTLVLFELFVTEAIGVHTESYANAFLGTEAFFDFVTESASVGLGGPEA